MKKSIFIIIISIMVFSGCSVKPVEETRFLFDTYCRIVVPGAQDRAKIAVGMAFKRLQEIEDKFNVHSEKSPLFGFNKTGLPVKDTEIIEIAELSDKISKESGGAFDITLYPLSGLWGFYSDSPAVPAGSAIKKCIDNVGHNGLIISNGNLRAGNRACKVDFGGIIKGYAVDEAVRVMKDTGIGAALIDLGGDLYAMGKNKSKPWKIGLRDPRGEGLISIFELSGNAVVTSGDYERFFIEKGERYHHILDPRTGYPAKGLQSVTIIGAQAVYADAWATAVFVLGRKKGLEAIEKLKGYEAIIIDSEGEVIFSSGLNGKISKPVNVKR
ncbi:FAD:protein FMN transferase [Elusimicrobiota bacterium]